MKISTVYPGLVAMLSSVAFADQPKQWLQPKQILDRQLPTSPAPISGNSSGPPGTIINGNGNTVLSGTGVGNHNDESNSHNTYNINNFLGPVIINNFASGAINYYSGNEDYYYAKMCPVCPIAQVHKANNTYTSRPCPVCPLEVLHCPGFTPVNTTTSHTPAENNTTTKATTGTCIYQQPICLSCPVLPSPAPPSLTTVTVPCPTCPSHEEVITCPSLLATSIASLASASGASVAKSVVSAHATAPVTVTAAATVAKPVAASTIVNVVCPTCPAGTKAVTVAQVPAAVKTESAVAPAVVPESVASPAAPVSPVAAGNVSVPAGNGPSTAKFTGGARTVVSSVVGLVFGVLVSGFMVL